MALLYQNHLRDLFKYADTCDPQVKCLVAAHSPFDSAINPMVFPHAGVAELPEVDGYIAQVWSDTARSEMTDPTRDGEDVEAVFQKAFLEYNYFQNLLRGTKKELIVLQDPKSDSEGFPWQTYRRWYEQTVVASSLLNVASFEVALARSFFCTGCVSRTANEFSRGHSGNAGSAELSKLSGDFLCHVGGRMPCCGRTPT